MSAENGWQFLDTNVLVYAFDVSAEIKHDQAKLLVAQLWRGKNGCISVQVLQEFYTVVMRKRLFRHLNEINGILEDLTQWKVHTPSPADVVTAVRLHQRHQVSFWDAMILHSAAQLGCKTLWSEDLNAGQVFTNVRVLNPFQNAKP
jgi:predicted nucleic acid-binding protein